MPISHADILVEIEKVEKFLQTNCQFFCNHCSYGAKWFFEATFHLQFYHASSIAAEWELWIQIQSKVEYQVFYALFSSFLEK